MLQRPHSGHWRLLHRAARIRMSPAVSALAAATAVTAAVAAAVAAATEPAAVATAVAAAAEPAAVAAAVATARRACWKHDCSWGRLERGRRRVRDSGPTSGRPRLPANVGRCPRLLRG